MPAIHFKTRLVTIGTWTILRLPEDASAKLPSRGQTMVEGTINGFPIHTPLEPDGRMSHWLKINAGMRRGAHAEAGDTVDVSIEPSKVWPEPDVPADLQKALEANKRAGALWAKITPMARWEWIRWIRATNKLVTRAHRVEVACSKLTSGMRRPCCWNRNLCTEPTVSKNGMLIEPATTNG